jgi:hypothetical protein
MKWPDNFEIGLKKNLFVYEMENIEINSETVQKLAKQFNLDGKIQISNDVLLIAQEKKVFTIYKNTGAFWYNDFSKLSHPDYKPELPSDEEARKIATSYLKKHKWLPEGAIPDSVQRNQFEQVEGKENRKRMTQANNVCVNFRFSIDNINTYGPGAKIKVFIGHKGEVIGLFNAWRPIRKFNEFPTLSVKELEAVLTRKLGLPLDEIVVRGIKLAYYAESCVVNTRFIQPVYIFDLAAPVKSMRQKKPFLVDFEMHPVPATVFAPVVSIKASSSSVEIKKGELLSLSYSVIGGTPRYKVNWDSNIDGFLSNKTTLNTNNLSISQRNGRITSHTIRLTVTDAEGLQDTHQILVKVKPDEGSKPKGKKIPTPKVPDDPYVGVEWCNIYHGTPGLADISGTDASAQGFNDYIKGLPNWSSRFNWGNDFAWEEDFKMASAPGGGTDTSWIDNVHFAFFAGHGSPGAIYFGSSYDDHVMEAQDARWGDGILNWITLHACQTMRSDFEWDVWCDAFKGLHMMFGFHTNTQGSTPPLGSRFAFWMSFKIPFFDHSLFDLRSAWELACTECFDSNMEFAFIYANQSGTDTVGDHLTGYGQVSADPVSPNSWHYYKKTC